MPGFIIKTYGSAVLRKRCKTLRKITDEDRRVLENMVHAMIASKGLGLAAPQVGIGKRLVVMLAGSEVLKLVNPRILKKKGSIVMKEGCLSFPGIFTDIKRAREVQFAALNEKGDKLKIKAGELPARIIQHEIDHLNGVLLCDRMGFIDRIKMRKALKDLKKQTESSK